MQHECYFKVMNEDILECAMPFQIAESALERVLKSLGDVDCDEAIEMLKKTRIAFLVEPAWSRVLRINLEVSHNNVARVLQWFCWFPSNAEVPMNSGLERFSKTAIILHLMTTEQERANEAVNPKFYKPTFQAVFKRRQDIRVDWWDLPPDMDTLE